VRSFVANCVKPIRRKKESHEIFEEERVKKFKVIPCEDPRRFGYEGKIEGVPISVDISLCEQLCDNHCDRYKEEESHETKTREG